MPRWILLSVVLGTSSLAIAAEEPRPLPKANSPGNTDAKSAGSASRLNHLRQAADHLREAGLDAAAADIDKQAEKLVQHAQSELHRKREQLEQLRAEIAELELLAGEVEQFQISCRILEIAESAAKDLGIGTQQNAFSIGPNPPTAGFSILETKRLEGRLEKLEAKVLADSVLVTNNRRPATMQAGGQFPVPEPRAEGQLSIQYRDFGTRMEALPISLGNNRVRLNVSAEHSRRDPNHAVTLAGFSVPGIALRRVNTEVEMRLGETLAQTFRFSSSQPADSDKAGAEDDPIITLFLITPTRAEAAPPSN
jgi:Flp pilus assembly secretin CpaC